MAINKNHEFEELNGVKCGIVEKNASAERVEFLKKILEFNGYEVIVVPSAPPKAAPATKAEDGSETPAPPTSFTIGVTDYTFNPINAIFGRSLKLPDGQIVTLAYWLQKEPVNNDQIPYFEHS
jgi:hypothetical protein